MCGSIQQVIGWESEMKGNKIRIENEYGKILGIHRKYIILYII